MCHANHKDLEASNLQDTLGSYCSNLISNMSPLYKQNERHQTTTMHNVFSKLPKRNTTYLYSSLKKGL
jgi:hypothetical protein